MKKLLISCLVLSASFAANAKMVIPIQSLTTPNTVIGTVTLEDTKFGLLITPDLAQLSPGMHGFHVHEKPSCENNGDAAGGHFDLSSSHEHKGPYDKAGHKGDLPALFVDAEGKASVPTLAPKLKEHDLKGRSIMIHAGADNYSDTPAKLGGGGQRVACGVVGS